MSEFTEAWLDMFELEMAGLVRRVMRPDGEEGWEPVEPVDLEALDAFLGEYDATDLPGEYEDPDGFWDEID